MIRQRKGVTPHRQPELKIKTSLATAFQDKHQSPTNGKKALRQICH